MISRMTSLKVTSFILKIWLLRSVHHKMCNCTTWYSKKIMFIGSEVIHFRVGGILSLKLIKVYLEINNFKVKPDSFCDILHNREKTKWPPLIISTYMKENKNCNHGCVFRNILNKLCRFVDNYQGLVLKYSKTWGDVIELNVC